MYHNRIRLHQPLVPRMQTLEEADRFAHRDLAIMAPMDAWAEAQLIERQLARLMYTRDHGRLITVVDGMPVYAEDWLSDRLVRLRATVRRKAAA